MRPPLVKVQQVLQLFHDKKVLTQHELRKATGCSTATLWRWLKRHGGITSYNDHARHYTLTGIPRFDEHGLWDYRQGRFSKWGSLTKTIVGLIDESPAGFNADQLQQLLHLKNVKPVLTRLIQQRRLTREKSDGRFVYFAVRQTPQRRQKRQRNQQLQRTPAVTPLPPLDQIVALLVEIIQRPRETAHQWSRRLARRGVRLGTPNIQAVLDHYGIDLKKGLSS